MEYLPVLRAQPIAKLDGISDESIVLAVSDRLAAGSDCAEKLNDIAGLILKHGGVDGAHHKQWLVDQIALITHGPYYESFVERYKREEGKEWDKGTPP